MFIKLAEFQFDAVRTLKTGVSILKFILCGNVANYFEKRKRFSHLSEYSICKAFRNKGVSLYMKNIQIKFHEPLGNPLDRIGKLFLLPRKFQMES
uniref:Uncharacterized protein n=1 Tax=Sarcophilus harrisii TaxID=9305 RepID=A0A7N4NWF2_SARHA